MSFTKNVSSSDGLTTTGVKATGQITLNGLGLANAETAPSGGYLQLSGTNPLNILTINPAAAATVQGIDITGSYGPITVSGATHTPPPLTNGITVLTLGGTGGITNSGNTNVEFTAVGSALTGATISAGQTYTAKGSESYSVTSDGNATAVVVDGTATWTGSFTAEALGTINGTTQNVVTALQIGSNKSSGTAVFSGPTVLKATASQGTAIGIDFNYGGGTSASAPIVLIKGPSLVIEVNGKAGKATASSGLSNYQRAYGIATSTGGFPATINSDTIQISSAAEGNQNLASYAVGVYGFTNNVINIGAENTQSIDISATATVTTAAKEGGPRDTAYAVYAYSGTINIGNENSTTTITAGLDTTPPTNNWGGNVVGINVSGSKAAAAVTLNGTGTVSVPQYEEGYSSYLNNYAILVSQQVEDSPGFESTLTVTGDWTANGQVGIGISSNQGVPASTLEITNGGSLTVNGDVLVKPVERKEQTAVQGKYNLKVSDGSLVVEGTLNNNDYGTVTVGGTDADGNPTNGSLTATNVVNEGTPGNGITINEGSTASVTGADPTGGAAFNNTGSLTVNGDLTVDNTLQNSGTSGSIVVGETDGAKGNLTAGKIVNSSSGDGVKLQSGTLTVEDVQNTGTFSTGDGTTLVVTGTVNADDDGNVGGLEGGKAITVGGDLVTDTDNFFDEDGNLLTGGQQVFTVTDAENLTLQGTLTSDQVSALRDVTESAGIVITEGVTFDKGTAGYDKQNFYKTENIGDLNFTYTQANTRNKEDPKSIVLTNLVIGNLPSQSANPLISNTKGDYLGYFKTIEGVKQFDQWSSMSFGSIDLGTGNQIYVAGATLQIGGNGGQLVTSSTGAATITVDQDGELIIGAEAGGSSATAQNLTVDVISGGQMFVQGNITPNSTPLEYSIGKVSLGNAYASTTVRGTSGNLYVQNANLSITTFDVFVATNDGKVASVGTAENGTTINVENGKLTVGNALVLNGLSSLSPVDGVPQNPITITLEKGTLETPAGLKASYTTIAGNGNLSAATGLELTNSQVTLTEGTIAAGTTALNGSVMGISGEGSITLGDTTLTESSLTTGNGSITMASATLIDSIIDVTDGDLTINGTLTASASTTKTNSTITVDNGSLTTGVANIGSGADVTVNVGPTASVSMGATTLAGTLTVNPSADATTLAPVTLASLAFGEESGSFVAGQQLAVQIGVDNMQAVNDAIAQAYPGVDFDNILAIGSTVQFNTADNGLTIGGTQTTGLNLNGSTAVYADLQSLKGDTLFASAEGAEPAVVITTGAQGPQFVLANPVGNRVYTVVDDGFDTTTVDLTENEIKTTNPLYTVYWENQDQDDPDEAVARDAAVEPNPTSFVVEINEDAVKGELNTIAPNTIIESANTPYGTNIGAETIMNILADIVDTSQYPEKAALINSIALRGAAAHAHEIGISAASMVVDSVWDHGSKLAAAPHEDAKADLWITLDWNHSRANDYKAAGLDNGYKLDLYGATFGADYDFANGLAAGLAVSVGGGEAKSKGYNAGQKTDVTYWGINLYGTYTSPIVNVIGNVGYIGIKNKTKVNGDKGRPDANIWTIGVKAEKDFAINEQFTVTPHVGVRYLSVDVDDFNLKGFHYGTDKANLVQFPIGVAFAANLKTANGAAVKPFLDLSFVPTAGDKKVDNTFGITGGSARDVIDTTIASTSMFQGKIGVNASYGSHNFGLNFAIGGGNKGRLDTGLQAKYRFVF